MLINCKECGQQISDKAISCPHCGYPINYVKSVKRKNRSHKRLPNGFGQITKITYHNLRKPYRAMVTIGFNEKGKPKTKLLEPVAYFETYNEAYEALLNYNKSNFNSENSSNMTMNDLFNMWIKNNYDENINKGTIKIYKSNWNVCKNIHDTLLTSLTSLKLKNFIENLETTSGQKLRIKAMMTTMLQYAVSLELLDKNIAHNLKLSVGIKIDNKNKYQGHISFTAEEMKILWCHTDNKIVRLILIQCFMGWRPIELCNLNRDNIDINNMTITAGVKTENGKNRCVPIHPLIQDFIMDFYNENGQRFYNYMIYLRKFKKTILEFGITTDHLPHDCRVTFITNCKTNGVEEYSIKRLAGHTVKDLTESVYTKHDLNWFRNEISKLKKYVYE